MANLSTKIEDYRMIKWLKKHWLKYERIVVLILGFVLVAAISFEFGLLEGQKWDNPPLVIEKMAQNSQNTENVGSGGSNSPVTLKNSPEAKIEPSGAVSRAVAPAITAKCAFVGSKNSKKFYRPNCPWAKQIKPENVVCFATAEEALGQGRTETKCEK